MSDVITQVAASAGGSGIAIVALYMLLRDRLQRVENDVRDVRQTVSVTAEREFRCQNERLPRIEQDLAILKGGFSFISKQDKADS